MRAWMAILLVSGPLYFYWVMRLPGLCPCKSMQAHN